MEIWSMEISRVAKPPYIYVPFIRDRGNIRGNQGRIASSKRYPTAVNKLLTGRRRKQKRHGA